MYQALGQVWGYSGDTMIPDFIDNGREIMTKKELRRESTESVRCKTGGLPFSEMATKSSLRNAI